MINHINQSTRQQTNAANKSTQNVAAKTPDRPKPGTSSGSSASIFPKSDSSRAKPTSTPNKQDDSSGNKRPLSSPFDESGLNPMKKKIPENVDSSFITEAGGSLTESAEMEEAIGGCRDGSIAVRHSYTDVSSG